MKFAALILAAGNGSRFNCSIPKQFCMLGEKKVYRYPLDTIISSNFFSEVCLVVSSLNQHYVDKNENHSVIIGADTRQKSVFLGLKSLTADFVVICDGVRPFLTKDILQKHIDHLKNGTLAVNTCIPCLDTINIKNHGKICSIPPRDQFLRGQTPQSFSLKHLLEAHKKSTNHFTDDCGLMLDAGYKISYVEGSEQNIKITTAIDLEIASLILNTHFTQK
jgi:2-C-methyl-D-erythritol 4-phosphate cytidylyltransferase